MSKEPPYRPALWNSTMMEAAQQLHQLAALCDAISRAREDDPIVGDGVAGIGSFARAIANTLG